MKNALIIGPGHMGLMYLEVLSHLKFNIFIMGRSEDSFKNFDTDLKYIKVISANGLLDIEKEKFDLIINCVSVDNLATVTKQLLKLSSKKYLIEKPGALELNQLKEIENLAKAKNKEIFIAYNRRFYGSVLETKKISNMDGGILSCDFDFTEWPSKFLDEGFSDKTLGEWFLANSTHVIDTVFYLIGKPDLINFISKRGIDWSNSPSIMTGSGLSVNQIPFSFHSNWESAGNWKIQIYTPKRKIILSPMEDFKYVLKDTNEIIEQDRTEIDREFKPGLMKMVKSILDGNNSSICSLSDHINNYVYYLKFRNHD